MSFNKNCNCLLAAYIISSFFIQISFAGNARFRPIEVPLEFGELLVRSIEQNKQGFIILGTDSGIYKYDGFKLSSYLVNDNDSKSLEKLSVSDLLSDNKGILWAATRGQGLYRLHSGELKRFNTDSEQQQRIESDFISEVLMDEDATLWLATERGLHSIDTDLQVKHFNYNEAEDNNWQFMTALLSINKYEILIGTKAGLILFNRSNQQFKKIDLLPENQTTVIYTLHQDQNGGLWVGSDNGVFYRPAEKLEFKQFKHELIPYKILSITSKDDDVWMGSISNGLFKYSLSKQNTQRFSYQREDKDSLPDNTILDLFVDASGVLWVSTFYKGLYNLDIQSLHFGLEKDSNESVECADNLLFSGFTESKTGDLWIANGTGLIQYNNHTGLCKRHAFKQGSHTIKSLLFDSQNQLWLATTKGLYQFDQQQEEFLALSIKEEQSLTNFVIEKKPGLLLLGTNDGLYEYNSIDKLLIRIISNYKQNNPLNLFAYSLSLDDEYYFASDAGVMHLSNQRLYSSERIQKQLPTDEILHLYFDAAEHLWVGTQGHGVFVFDTDNNLLFHESYFGDEKQNSIKSIIQADNGDIWLGSDSGLIRVEYQSFEFKVFYPSDGVQGLSFNINSAYKSQNGRLYMGGRNGFNAFYPQLITTNSTPPEIAFTDFTHFGKSVNSFSTHKSSKQSKPDFTLEKPINELQQLTLSHQDYVVGFEFAVLDYSDPNRNQYAYQMEGLDPNWNFVNAENRRISYSNLKPGNYVFRVKGANKHGIWNSKEKSILIKVLPSPWMSWWAISSYLLISLTLIIWFLGRKNRLNQRINLKLKSEIEKQTNALQTEKNTVEELLTKKNQLFANVSHEFRTPMTLILGPIKNLLSTPLTSSQHQSLEMIFRNANRLMTMIEQLLQLAKMSGKQNIIYQNIEAHSVIEVLTNQFRTLAEAKHIDLELLKNDKATLHLSQDALDVVLSNLLSNAIKYTPNGGRITVESQLQANTLKLTVNDSGAGLNDQQKLHIFERFKRLDRDQNIEGIGIGLSVVKELVKMNKGTIVVDSQPGLGSRFSISFDTTEDINITPQVSSKPLLVKQLVLTTENSTIESSAIETSMSQFENKEHKQSVLIIDDNTDMRNYIADILSKNYKCSLASGGKEGISMAIQLVPDVVICDVMMPEVDGFHVSRVLRSDTRTSHIPLMLLTALDDKESRVRGWREHVDVYLTKPFDAQELLLQLENILVIRSILSQKAGSNLQAGQESGLIDLPKKDQLFIKKLNQLIIENYKNPNFLRQQMANNMAVSDRQLQRKLKALIDKNPNDLLREYRLSQAAIMLKDGYQVSVTSEECGFNSLPHFSKCFKSQFGLPPKAYQKACK